MSAFRVIPVIDLRRGRVVRARAGDRNAYAPIQTPLASGDAPADIALGLLKACPAQTLYVADLDAIVDGLDPDRASLEAIAAACPNVELWVDAGFMRSRQVESFVSAGLGRPVLGTESQSDVALVARFGGEAVLSLDTRGPDRLDPAGLHDRADLWPTTVIVMSLARVGRADGPDIDAISAARERRPDARIYAAGGVRNAGDIDLLRRTGAAGALVASALHEGAL